MCCRRLSCAPVKRGHLVVVKSNLRDHCPLSYSAKACSQWAGYCEHVGPLSPLRLTPRLPFHLPTWVGRCGLTKPTPHPRVPAPWMSRPLSGFTEQTGVGKRTVPQKVKSLGAWVYAFWGYPQSGGSLPVFLETPKLELGWPFLKKFIYMAYEYMLSGADLGVERSTAFLGYTKPWAGMTIPQKE